MIPDSLRLFKKVIGSKSINNADRILPRHAIVVACVQHNIVAFNVPRVRKTQDAIDTPKCNRAATGQLECKLGSERIAVLRAKSAVDRLVGDKSVPKPRRNGPWSSANTRKGQIRAGTKTKPVPGK